MNKYLKTYRNLILTAQVDYLHGFHHLDTFNLKSRIWILFYMFNYVNLHSICIFFDSWNGFFSKGVQSDEVTFPFFPNEGHKFTPRILNTNLPPREESTHLYDLESTLELVSSLAGFTWSVAAVSAVRKTKRPGEVVFSFAGFFWRKKKVEKR